MSTSTPHHTGEANIVISSVTRTSGRGNHRLNNVHARIDEILTSFQEQGPAIQQFADLVVEISNAEYAAILNNSRRPSCQGESGNLESNSRSAYVEHLQSLYQQTVETKKAQCKQLPEISGTIRYAACVPVHTANSPPSGLVAVFPKDSSLAEANIAKLQLVASAIVRWHERAQVLQLGFEARVSSALAELVSKIESRQSSKEACFTIANELKTFFGCDAVIVGMAKEGSAGVHVQAVSGISHFDRRSETGRRAKAALDEALVRNQLTVWPAASHEEQYATLAHRKLADQMEFQTVIGAPLVTVDGATIGAWLIAGDKSLTVQERLPLAVQTMSPHLASAVDICHRAEPGWTSKIWRCVSGDAESKQRRWATLIAFGLLLGTLLLPLPHRIRTGCHVEPVRRRFVAAPFAGILKSTNVNPGDMVIQGQIIAAMDDRELRWELSSLHADRNRFSKQQDKAMAMHEIAEVQLAEFEQERVDIRIKLLKHRENNLLIRSPIEGVVLVGDLDDALGAPVDQGQPLFEIAPIESIKLEIDVLEEDIAYVRRGMEIRARLDGCPDAVIVGQVDRIFPQAEIRDANNVFVAEVELQNPNGALRPGMSGSARVMSTKKSLAWIWFHKAWHRLCIILGV